MIQGTGKSREDLSKGVDKTHTGGEIYLYKDSGIRERHGRIPLWLKLVGLGLVVWGIYYTVRYTVRYWNAS